MRRVAGVLLVAFIVLFSICGCKEKKQVTPNLDSISGSFNMNVQSVNCSGTYFYGGGILKIEILQKSGMPIEFEADEKGIRVSYLELSYECKEDTAQKTIAAIKRIFDYSASGNPAKIGKMDGLYEISDKVYGMNYSMYFTADGLPAFLNIPSLKLEAKFTKQK